MQRCISSLPPSGQRYPCVEQAAALYSDPFAQEHNFPLCVFTHFFLIGELILIECECCSMCLGIKSFVFYIIFLYFSASFLIGISIKY